jgi:hypothetical protein
MNKKGILLMVSLFFMLAVCSSGQEQDSQAIIGEWIHVGPKDGGLGVITFTDRQVTLKGIPFGYGSEETLTSGYKISNGTIVFDDGEFMEYSITDNDTLSIDLWGEFKRTHQNILLNGSFYLDNDNGELNYDESFWGIIWGTSYIEFLDGQKGSFYILGTCLPFEYEIYDIYLILKFDHRRDVFIIKSDTLIEGLYTSFDEDIIFKKK